MLNQIIPRSALLSHLILIITQLNWAWDFILFQSFFQPRGPEFLKEYADMTTYEKGGDPEESEECAVCLCRIEQGDDVRELRCQHFFHAVCLDRWLGYGHATCPLCRNNLWQPRLAADLHHELIVIDICAASSRDDRHVWKTQGASWLLNSWSTLILILQNHVSITIKNGTNTRLNDYHWVPRLRGGKPELYLELMLVKDLMCGRGRIWDAGLIRALFKMEDVGEILKIEGLNPRTEDVWSCSFSKKGRFSVKTMYFMLFKSKIPFTDIIKRATMIQIVPQSGLLTSIILAGMHLKWAWDFLLRVAFFQHSFGQILHKHEDDFSVARYKDVADGPTESAECAVCLCGIDKDDEVRELRCEHLFHWACLDRWLGYGHMTCPVCRNRLKLPPVEAEIHQELVVINYCTAGGRERCLVSISLAVESSPKSQLEDFDHPGIALSPTAGGVLVPSQGAGALSLVFTAMSTPRSCYQRSGHFHFQEAVKLPKWVVLWCVSHGYDLTELITLLRHGPEGGIANFEETVINEGGIVVILCVGIVFWLVEIGHQVSAPRRYGVRKGTEIKRIDSLIDADGRRRTHIIFIVRRRTPIIFIVETRISISRLGVNPLRRESYGQDPDQCSVCLCSISPGDVIRELKSCGHVFHAACLERWVGYGHWTCPLCRNHVTRQPVFSDQDSGQRWEVLVLNFGHIDSVGNRSSWWLRVKEGVLDTNEGSLEDISSGHRTSNVSLNLPDIAETTGFSSSNRREGLDDVVRLLPAGLSSPEIGFSEIRSHRAA
ncbi:RING/U-box superfamily protein, partial [Striga asiatica]